MSPLIKTLIAVHYVTLAEKRLEQASREGLTS
jgi:hypothetical protein